MRTGFRKKMAEYFAKESKIKTMKNNTFTTWGTRHNIILAIGMVAGALAGNRAQATPYASGVTNNSGVISFYLNEGGGNVTVTYEDATTNANYNGSATGTNLASGDYTFQLGSHTSYSISVYKVGSGVPTLITNSFAFTPRGIDVNKRPASPYFGRVYAAASSDGGIYVMNPDLTLALPGVHAAGVSWQNNGFSPYRLSVAEDDYLMVGDASYTGGANAGNDGVWRLDPNAANGQLFLGPRGEANGLAAGVFATVESRPILIGNPQNGPVTLMQVDGDFPAANGQNSLLVYSNITLATLPWETPPDIQGPEIGLNLSSRTLGGNSYPGLQIGPNGYIYAGTYRENYSNPLLQIYAYDPASGAINPIWNSLYNNGTADYFRTTVNGLTHGTVDIAVSADGRYVVGVSIDNWFVICPLTNGIPDVGNLFVNTPTSTSGNGRGVAFDAADNLYLSSSGLGLVQSWSLGITTIATTTGNASGGTGFQLVFPSTEVNVVATTNSASQGGANGLPGVPVPGAFLITRTNANNDYSTPVTVNFSLGGTASNGVYAVSPSTIIPANANNSVLLPPGVIFTNIIITPTTNNVPRLTTTVVLTLKGGPSYSVQLPSSGTVYIQNTSSNQLALTAGAPTMYKAFSNDFASVTITRLGDTNVPTYTVPASAFTYSGTAIPNTDFTPLPPVTFNPGDITQITNASPLSNGVPPIHTDDAAYVGDKSVSVGLQAGPEYIVSGANSTVLTLIDNADLATPVLFADPLTDANDAVHWNVTYGTGDQLDYPANYTVEFGYDLTSSNPESSNNGLIGLPPSGATRALRITCNKSASQTYGGGVNVYYTNQVFSGNYAVRFNMNLLEGSGVFSVEGAMFGINHNGSETNWWLGSGTPINNSGPWASDGVWYWIQAPPGGAGGFGFSEFEEYTGAGGSLPNTGWTPLAAASASTYRNVFKNAVFSAPGGISGGTPANNSPFSTTPADDAWSDVEIKQVNNTVTLTIDKTQIFSYKNTTHFTNGFVMFGYDCPIEGAFQQYVGTPEAAAYFSNLRVVSLAAPVISSVKDAINANQNNVTILFSSFDSDDVASSFALQSSGTNGVTGPYADVNSAAISQVLTNNGTAIFLATASATNTAEFYRIRHK